MASHKKAALTFTTGVVLSLSLLLLGVIHSMIKSAHHAALQSQKNIKLEIFFNQDLSSESEMAWIESLQNKPEILKTHIVTKEQAQLDFKNLMKNEWGGLVDEASLVGRLPASLIVEFQQDNSPQTRQKVANEIMNSATQFESYDGSVFQKDWAQWFSDYSVLAQRMALVLGAVVFFMLYFIISNLVRAQVSYKADEIEILSFLGATDWQIQKPFIAKAIVMGMVSTLASVGLLFYLTEFLKRKFISQSHLFSVDLIQSPGVFDVLTLAAIVCLISAWAARSCVRERLVS